MAKEKQVDENLKDFNFPAEGITVRAKNQADAEVKLKELLKANK